MNRRFFAWPLVLFVMTAASLCIADDKPAETAWYPLKIGTTWHYKAAGNELVTTVTKYEVFDNQLCARIDTSVGDKVIANEHIAVKDDGVYRVAFAGNKVDPALRFMRLPAEKDQTWNVKSTSAGAVVTGTFKSAILDEVVVPAGTYKNVYTCEGECDVNGTKVGFTYYFAKDVGIIKQVIKAAGQEVLSELVKFEPGK